MAAFGDTVTLSFYLLSLLLAKEQRPGGLQFANREVELRSGEQAGRGQETWFKSWTCYEQHVCWG